MSVLSVVILLATGWLLLYAVKAYRKRQQLRKIAAHFGGAKPHWLLGHLLEYPANDVPGIFDAMVQRHTDHGKDLFNWGLLNDHMVIVSSAANVAKVVMAKKTQKSTFYQFIEVWLGQGLLISQGDKWFQRRRIITPTFHFNILAAFAEVFNREANVLVEKLKPHASTGLEFDIYEPVSLYALNSICLTSMGVDVNAQTDPTNQYVRDVKRMSELILLRIFHVLSSFPQLYWYTMPHAWEQRKLIRRLHAFTDSVIRQRRQRLLNNRPTTGGDQKHFNDNVEESRYAKRKETFLDLLLSVTVDGRPLSDLDIREEVDTFMFEGHDTTSSAIAFTFLQLAGHREIQDKLYREIVDTLGPAHRTVPLTYATLQNFRYLDMVVKESLRLLPPVSFIGRRLVEDLELNGVTVPAGSDCLIPIYVIHRNPDVYPDPERFDPERFADGSSQRRGPYDYIPFSVGARNCIGQRFALLEMKISIIRMVSHYHIHPGDGIRGVRLKTDLVLRPDKGIPIKLSARPQDSVSST
ncbi:cytochrome P450 4d8-like [Anopheles bellator]|uniref:cytochrome P450 4d8-like n=1 Tax=Anopheles bellator TaxID=139047 RepID=UPI0026480AFA|nr:cytochrome P450 4d8-like [Anopheles bellator]